jgi:hypothetical protein
MKFNFIKADLVPRPSSGTVQESLLHRGFLKKELAERTRGTNQRNRRVGRTTGGFSSLERTA